MVPRMWLWWLCSASLPPDVAIDFFNQVLSSPAIRVNRKLVALTQVGEIQMPRLASHRLACLQFSYLFLLF